MTDLKTQIYFTIRGSKKSVEQLADEVGCSASLLYRYGLDGESGAEFPLKRLLPLMQATGDFRILRHLNARCGLITVNQPRVRRLKLKDPKTVNEIQQNFATLFAEFCKFCEAASKEQVAELLDAIHLHACDVAAMDRAVRDFQQGDLF
ncbi:MAG: phage regulatory CII family protein [Bryobacteraceae bacterium]